MDYNAPPRSSPPTTQAFRYISLAQDADEIVNEKVSQTPKPSTSTREHRKKRPTSLSRQPERTTDPYHDYLHPHTSNSSLSSSGAYPSAHWTPWTPYYAHAHSAQKHSRQSHPYSVRSPALSPSRFLRQPASPISLPTHTSEHSYPPTGPGIVSTMRPWLPLIMYAISSLAFVVAIAFYKTELFTFLDDLSLWLRADEQYGHAVMFGLIFLTTIPPIPLYSTLIILSGYTFGAWTGALISYFAALSGALTVFLVSRHVFRSAIESWLVSCTTIHRVVRAIEKRPKLLFLIRLAPYPYNVMNCLLAASPTLSLHTYTVCTALSLFKVIVHTSVGASIHSFRDYHSDAQHDSSPSDDVEGGSFGTDSMARLWTILGILLCVLILVYLGVVARRAVDEELDDGPVTVRDVEETRGFLSGGGDGDSSDTDVERGGRGRQQQQHPYYRQMTEIPFRGSR
ncbi:hypothetical protein CPC08DRAFT_623513 [Agrocybe pediades]|nr:hypothetical protein CPC08DRAFT_623513 [Agrocybe pediades]